MASIQVNRWDSGDVGLPDCIDLGDFDVVPTQSSYIVNADADQCASGVKNVCAYCFVGEMQPCGEIYWFYAPLEDYDAKKLRVERSVVVEALSNGDSNNDDHFHDTTRSSDVSLSRNEWTGDFGRSCDECDIFNDMRQTKLYMRISNTGKFVCYVRREVALKLQNLMCTPSTPMNSVEKNVCGVGSLTGMDNSSVDSAVAQRLFMGCTSNFTGLGNLVETSSCAHVQPYDSEKAEGSSLFHEVASQPCEQLQTSDCHCFLQSADRQELDYGRRVQGSEILSPFADVLLENNIMHATHAPALPSLSQNTRHSASAVDSHAMHSVPLLYSTHDKVNYEQDMSYSAVHPGGDGETSTSCVHDSSSNSHHNTDKRPSHRLHFRSTDGVGSSSRNGADSISLAQSMHRRADANASPINSQPIIRRLLNGRRTYV